MVKYTAVIAGTYFQYGKEQKWDDGRKCPTRHRAASAGPAAACTSCLSPEESKQRPLLSGHIVGKKLDMYNSAYLFTLIKISQGSTFGDQMLPISQDALSLEERGIIGNSMGYAVKAACEGCFATADDELMTFSVE